MELRQAITEALNNPAVKGADFSLLRQLRYAETITPAQKELAERTLKEYGIEIRYRRAVLRENIIYCFGELQGEDLEKFRDIPGRSLEKNNLNVPCNQYSIDILREMRYKFSQNLIDWEEERKSYINLQSQEFDNRLYPFQIEGVEQIEKLKGRVLLSDEVGLGKTAQVCVYLKRNPDLKKILIICPSGLRLNWKKELELWGVDLNAKIINGFKDRLPKSGITIMSYNVVYNYYNDIEDMNYDILICDESQALIHESSQRTKAVKYATRGIEKIIMISATPLTSRPKNLFTQLNILSPEIFNTQYEFLTKYCNGRIDPTGKGCTNADQLHRILSSTMMIRRKRKDVIDQLPEKTYQVIPIQINQSFRNEYEFAKKEIISYIKENYGNTAANRARFGETMVRMEHLKQIAVNAKMDDGIEYIRTITESGEPVVVFATHKFVIERLCEEFKDSCLKIDGSLSVKQKQANIDQFQKDGNIMVMACNIQAGGVGVTLTRSSHIVFLQYPWTPGEIIQGIGRIDRIGQKSMSLTIHYVIADNTIDEIICNILDKKSRVLGDILDAGAVDEGLLFNELIDQFKNM